MAPLANGFAVVDIPKAPLLLRLLGRVSREAAFIELRNLLATTPYTSISAADVRAILSKAALTTADTVRELEQIFEQATLYLTADHDLNDDDARLLRALQRAFGLDCHSADRARTAALRAVYRRVMREALIDNSFTASDKERMDRTAQSLGLTPYEAAELFNECAVAAVQRMFDEVVVDRCYTGSEEAAVKAFAQSLGVTIQYDDLTARIVERFRQIGQIADGNLPIVPVDLMLQRREVCHFAAPNVVHKEMRVVTRRVNYSGPTASVRITKGLRWRIGSLSVDRVSEDVLTQVDTGDFYITNKRLFFQGLRKNSSIQLSKIMQFAVFNDALRIEKSTGKDIYIVGTGDWEQAGACIDAAIDRAR